jgi:hypothetical protein
MTFGFSVGTLPALFDCLEMEGRAMEGTIRFSAVVVRLRRRLAKDEVRLVKTRGGAANRWYFDLGEWHTVDAWNRSSGHVDPVSLARGMGLVGPNEIVLREEDAVFTG